MKAGRLFSVGCHQPETLPLVSTLPWQSHSVADEQPMSSQAGLNSGTPAPPIHLRPAATPTPAIAEEDRQDMRPADPEAGDDVVTSNPPPPPPAIKGKLGRPREAGLPDDPNERRRAIQRRFNAKPENKAKQAELRFLNREKTKVAAQVYRASLSEEEKAKRRSINVAKARLRRAQEKEAAAGNVLPQAGPSCT